MHLLILLYKCITQYSKLFFGYDARLIKEVLLANLRIMNFSKDLYTFNIILPNCLSQYTY